MENSEQREDMPDNVMPVNDCDAELYSIDICPSKKYVIFGGKSNSAEVYSYDEDRTITRIDNFEDSVIFTKFISDSRFIIVTASGTIALMEYDSDVCIIDLEEDISVAIFNDKLVIGTESGRVHLYDAELEHINTFGGHSSEIFSVDYQEGRILSMSVTQLVAHDENGRELYTLRAGEAYAFKYLASDTICFARDGKIQLMKQRSKLFEYGIQERVETIEFVDKSLVIGGEFEHILLIDTTGHHAIFKLDVGAQVNMIKRIGEYIVIFATADGEVGTVDIRNISTLKYYSADVGTIFDLCISGSDVGVVGEYGFGMINIDEYKSKGGVINFC